MANIVCWRAGAAVPPEPSLETDSEEDLYCSD